MTDPKHAIIPPNQPIHHPKPVDNWSLSLVDTTTEFESSDRQGE